MTESAYATKNEIFVCSVLFGRIVAFSLVFGLLALCVYALKQMRKSRKTNNILSNVTEIMVS